jgi:hypothetical protein
VPPILSSAAQRPRLLFDLVPSRRLKARETALTAETGQAATHARTTPSDAVDRAGVLYSVPPYIPAFSWGELDFDDAVQAVGLVLDGDTLTYPFKPAVPITIYLRLSRGMDSVAGTILAIGGASGARLTLSEDPAAGYSVTYHNGTTSVTSSVDTRFVHDDRVELLVVLDSTLTLSYSIRGCATQAGATSASIAQTAWGTQTMRLCAKLDSTLPTSHTLVRCAVAFGTATIESFRPGGRVGTVSEFSVAMSLQETSAGVFEFVDGAAVADLELADVAADGVYEAIPAGDSPGATRITAKKIVGHNVLVY